MVVGKGRAVVACLRAQEDTKICVTDMGRKACACDIGVRFLALQGLIVILAWRRRSQSMDAIADVAVISSRSIAAATAGDAAAAATAGASAAVATGHGIQNRPFDALVIEEAQRILARTGTLPHRNQKVVIPAVLGVASLTPILRRSRLHVPVPLLEVLHVFVQAFVILDTSNLVQSEVLLYVAVHVVDGYGRDELTHSSDEAAHADTKQGELQKHPGHICVEPKALQHPFCMHIDLVEASAKLCVAQDPVTVFTNAICRCDHLLFTGRWIPSRRSSTPCH
mmetsp:Transcript_54592/g.151451  ORF Transcript_54592/g.151451 Transcript_54592/m.151451 type:complete len:281 (+) Transcript_54592:1942-2784(+)